MILCVYLTLFREKIYTVLWNVPSHITKGSGSMEYLLFSGKGPYATGFLPIYWYIEDFGEEKCARLSKVHYAHLVYHHPPLCQVYHQFLDLSNMLKTCILATEICKIFLTSLIVLRERQRSSNVKITLLMTTLVIFLCHNEFNLTRLFC